MPLRYLPFTSATRNEIEIELIPFEGEMPLDLYGHVFFNTPVGSVNSNGTPVPKYLPDGTLNPEYGVMIFNGDGMVFRFDLDEPGKVKLKTGLLRTPCFYADEATMPGTPYYEKGYYFKSLGIAREGTALGSRNQLNTAFNMFKFPGDQHTRLTANFDAGRPYEVDVSSLILKTPIGANKEWRQELPALLEDTFELVQSSAHPSFDPVSKEFFTVCFNKDFFNLVIVRKLDFILTHHTGIIEAEFKALLLLVEGLLLNATQILNVLSRFISWINNKIATNHQDAFTLEHIKDAINNPDPDDLLGMKNEVTLMRWTGEGPIKKWNVLDGDTGKNILIHQTMHQTNYSKDYILLVDCSLKFALDIMMTNPFPAHPWLDRLLRQLLSKTLLPYTPFYIIKRSDLTDNAQTVTAKKATVNLETVHFSINYENPGNLITIHTAHNTASCAAEWVRPYDFLAIDPDKAVIENTIGLMTTGEMDIGRIGKIVINGETGIITAQSIICEKGFEGDSVSDVKAHTWAVGLHTYRDIISADKPVGKINQIYWQSYGLDYRFLTVYIKNLYENYKNRIIPVDKILEYNKKGIPFCIFRQDTNKMTIEDFYIFEMNQNFRSMQFVPRKKDGSNVNHIDPELDGYLFCTMVNGSKDIANDNDSYSREIWIFDAASLIKGPVCKLSHPEMVYAFTIHSAWMEDCVSSPTSYNIAVRADYDEVISNFKPSLHKETIQQLMKEEVYPHFNS